MRVKNENHQFHRDSSARRHREDPPRAPERSDGRRALGRPAAHPGQPASPAETRHAAGRRRAARAATGPRSGIPLISRALLGPAGSRKPRIFFKGTALPRRRYAPNGRAKRAGSPTAKARLNAQIPLKSQVSTLQRPSRPQQSATSGVRFRPPSKTVFKDRREGGRKYLQKSAKGPRENGRTATNS
jgi:hypothetical protein